MADDNFQDALKDYQAHYDAERDNREQAEEDNRFCASDQWVDAIRKQRQEDFRPVLTIDKTGQFVRQVSGDWRKSSPTVEVIPDDDDADPQMAQIFDGMIRQIEYESGAAQVYSWGLECAVRCGIGHWRIGTRYAEGATFDQEVFIDRIIDPLSVTWDAASNSLDRSDAKVCYVSDLIPIADFKSMFKDKSPADFPEDGDDGWSVFWGRGDLIRIASRYCVEMKKSKIGLLEDGRIVPVKGKAEGFVQVREIEEPCVYHQLMSGQDWLSDKEKLPGRYIPVVPVIGEEIAVDGRLIRRGIIRTLKDPQRLYNIALSAQAEIIGAQPKAPFIGPLSSFKGLERYWNAANKANLPFLPYNPDAALKNGGMPERSVPPQGAPGFVDQLRLANEDMFSVTGIYPSALGQKSNETSGKAIEARQREADTGTFVYFDNANLAIKRTGEILVDLIQAVYDGERKVRLMSKEGKQDALYVNRGVPTAEGPAIENDLTVGRYTAKIKTGPNYATAKEQARDMMADLMQNPNIAPVIADLYVKNLDIPGGDEISERLKHALPPQLLGEQQGPPDPMAEMANRLQMQEAEAKTKKTQAEAFDKEQSGIGKQIDNAAKAASIQQYGVEPPQHVQKDADRQHDMSKTREGQAFNMSEAERGRQFSREERREAAQEQPAQ